MTLKVRTRGLALGVALAGSAASPVIGQDVMGVAFKSPGQCMAAFAHFINNDWRQVREAGKTGGISDYQYSYRCQRIGEYWYIVPF